MNTARSSNRDPLRNDQGRPDPTGGTATALVLRDPASARLVTALLAAGGGPAVLLLYR
ncbi:hypothetical protein [Arthrobacter sp. UYEF3]|uniref:hypothetical protein n=1 Tax=Arthrobacter sp. UYEF3 TaxID=1756365 RepID=UPI00339A6F83